MRPQSAGLSVATVPDLANMTSIHHDPHDGLVFVLVISYTASLSAIDAVMPAHTDGSSTSTSPPASSLPPDPRPRAPAA